MAADIGCGATLPCGTALFCCAIGCGAGDPPGGTRPDSRGSAPKQPGSMQEQGRDSGVGVGPGAREGWRARSASCITRLWISLTLVLLLLGDATGRLRPCCFPRSPVAAARCSARSARPACVPPPAPRVRGLAILPAARVVSPAAAGHYKYSTLNWQRHPGGHTVHFTLVS